MATVSSPSSGDVVVDFPEKLFEPSKKPRPLLEATAMNGLSPTPFHDDLMGNISIYTIWMRYFDEDKDNAGHEWHSFRKNAIHEYEAFDRGLKEIEEEFHPLNEVYDFLNITSILEKKTTFDALCTRIEECEENFLQVTKVFEQFSQYLPNEAHRIKVNSMTQSIRLRYFTLLQQRNKKREIFVWITPRLETYSTSGKEMKIWLDVAEPRAEEIAANTSDPVAKSEAAINKLIGELIGKREVYEDFSCAGKGVLSIQHEIKEVVNADVIGLEQDLTEVIRRWDALCLLLEKLLKNIEEEKKEAELEKKTEVEKIDIRIEDQANLCTCEIPFKITKVGDGKYTFGTSKQVRLVRIHGQSIVVRVGGGWEYVYNFLLKVDPCRAKAVMEAMHNEIDEIKYGNNGLRLTPLNEKDNYSMNVQRLKKTSIVAAKKARSGSLRGTKSIDCLDRVDSGRSTPVSVLNSAPNSTPNSIPNSPRNPRSRMTRRSTIDAGMGKSPCSTPEHKCASKKLSNTDSKLYKSTENINRIVSDTRRMSLMERQNLYKQKKSASFVQSSTLLDV